MLKLKLFLIFLNIKRFDATLRSLHFKIRRHGDNVNRIVVIELNTVTGKLLLVANIVRLKVLLNVHCNFGS